MQEVDSVNLAAIDAVNDEAQVGAANRFIRPRDDKERARRALCATPLVAPRIGAGLETGHQYVFQCVSRRLSVMDGRHDTVKHLGPWQRIPLHENIQRLPISMIAGSAVAGELDDVSL